MTDFKEKSHLLKIVMILGEYQEEQDSKFLR